MSERHLNFEEECVLRQLVPGLSYPALVELLLLASDLCHLAALLHLEAGKSSQAAQVRENAGQLPDMTMPILVSIVAWKWILCAI